MRPQDAETKEPRSIPVAPLEEIPEGQARVFEVADGIFVAVCRVGGEVFAVEDRCTHDDGPFGDGPLHGHEIQCPRHGARFDVRDGSVRRMPACGPIPCYRVRIEEGWVIVELEGPASGG